MESISLPPLPSPPLPSPPPASPRFVFIDGLRGVAAVAVLLFHISTSDFFNHAPGWIDPFNKLMRSVGFLGVEIFFVISGFVITYSLRNAAITGRFFGKFVLRRSLRIDPPYWAAIAATLIISIVFTRFLHATTYAVPSASTLAANVFYVQGILHRRQMLIVFWTLCYEIQFYLFYILLQFSAQKITRGSRASHSIVALLLMLTGTASLLCFARDSTMGGWSYNWWYHFAFGAILCRSMLVDEKIAGPAGALILLSAAVFGHRLEPAAGAFAGMALYAAIRLNGLCTWLCHATIQYLGRISYSLYLTHTLVLQIVAGVLLRVRVAAVFHSIPAYLLMVAVPVGCAEIFYRAIEKPSHRWATRVSQRKTSPPPLPRVLAA